MLLEALGCLLHGLPRSCLLAYGLSSLMSSTAQGCWAGWVTAGAQKMNDPTPASL